MTKLSAKQRTDKVLRVNNPRKLDTLNPRASAQMRRDSGPYVPSTAPPGRTPAPNNSQFQNGTYTGQELQAYTGRPGAMDAFDKTSLYMGKLYYRAGSEVSA